MAKSINLIDLDELILQEEEIKKHFCNKEGDKYIVTEGKSFKKSAWSF